MHLHNYAWNLALTTTELRIISKALAGDDLTVEEEEQAMKLAGTIKTIYAVKRKRPKNANSERRETENEDAEDEPISVGTEH